MDITRSVENSDGSLTIDIDMTEEESRILIEYAILHIIKSYIEEHKDD
jgi:hypothetical protein